MCGVKSNLKRSNQELRFSGFKRTLGQTGQTKWSAMVWSKPKEG